MLLCLLPHKFHHQENKDHREKFQTLDLQIALRNCFDVLSIKILVNFALNFIVTIDLGFRDFPVAKLVFRTHADVFRFGKGRM